MNLFEQYGIKEVADVTFFEISAAGEEIPVLYLDTLKVSTLEQTATQTEARGGKGNPPLIIWDYGKEITVNLEDALFSMQSLAMLYSNEEAVQVSDVGKAVTIHLTEEVTTGALGAVTLAKTTNDQASDIRAIDPTTGERPAVTITGSDITIGTEASKVYRVFYRVEQVEPDKAVSITISAGTFPGTYKIVGDTYARNRNTGKDEYFQFIIPRAKMGAEVTLTMEAEGDPSTFNMPMRVLRPADGKMMYLVKYSLED